METAQITFLEKQNVRLFKNAKIQPMHEVNILGIHPYISQKQQLIFRKLLIQLAYNVQHKIRFKSELNCL